MKNNVVAYAPIIIKLLQGPLFSDEAASWSLLLHHTQAVQAYFAQIGLEVQVHDEDGFAFLHQPTLEDDEGRTVTLPRLTRRDRMNYITTLLCVLLREQLDHFESNNLDNSICIVTKKQLQEMLLPFMAERNNELTAYKKVDATINHVLELGFLKRLPHLTDDEYFEIRRIIKARITTEQLLEIKEKLEHHGTQQSDASST